MKELLVVVDMQNDFVAEEGVLSSAAAREIVPFVVEKAQGFLVEGKNVVFTMDTHQPDDLEFKRWPAHCVRGTWGQRLMPELEELVERYQETGNVNLTEKQRYSAFYNTGLHQKLDCDGTKGLRPDKVYFTGVATNICVFFTMADFANRDIEILVYRRGVASFDQEAHDFMLRQMESVLGAQIV